MSRFRLRHQSSDFELPEGEFLIGRSSACQLVLDDALVSRQHARILVAGATVTVEDLGSRNGVRVNARRIEGPTPVRHLDRIGVGAHDVLLLDAAAEHRPHNRGDFCTKCGAAVEPADDRCKACGSILAQRRPTLDQRTLELHLSDELRNAAPSSKPPAVAALVMSIAHKAFALGRIDEAERILAPHLDQLLATANEGAGITPSQLREATDLAFRLSDLPTGARWVGYVIALHTAARRLPEPAVVDRLHELVRKTRFTDVRALQRYLDVLASQTSRLSAGDRFLVKRVEGLLRLVSA